MGLFHKYLKIADYFDSTDNLVGIYNCRWCRIVIVAGQALKKIIKKIGNEDFVICENRYGMSCLEYETVLDRSFPLSALLKKNNIQNFSKLFNKDIIEISHHLSHAYAVLPYSPFEKSLIVVIDGSGSLFKNTKEYAVKNYNIYGEEFDETKQQLSESISVYKQNGKEITCLEKYWQDGSDIDEVPLNKIFNGVGMFYEYAAKYIFNSKDAAGKVMGLSSFGEEELLEDRVEYIKNLDWSKSFKGNNKEDWEVSEHSDLYSNIAASVQRHYEEYIQDLIVGLKEKYGEFSKLILTGGCALNCVANSKLKSSKIFDNLYVPAFPDDKGISYGAANYIKYKVLDMDWSSSPIEGQKANLGENYSISTKQIKDTFKGYKVICVEEEKEFFASKRLAENKIIAVFQEGSETGARALGNRSILSSLSINNLKKHLNSSIKFREEFRPYGASCLQEFASKYFDVEDSFQSSFMSYTPKIRPEYLDSFKEVSHIDGTSRIQTVEFNQNSFLYKLIKSYGELTDIYCLLNTSFNVMGEPIIETLEDCKTFFDKVEIDGILINNNYITRK